MTCGVVVVGGVGDGGETGGVVERNVGLSTWGMVDGVGAGSWCLDASGTESTA
jgi:hypothetical protein